jgi:hypothetical protein
MDIDEGLQTLLRRGFTFRDLRDERGEVFVLLASYGWPTCSDRLHIYGEDEAIAARIVPSTRTDVDDVLWCYEDGALGAINALLELPAPDEPGAPRLARRAPLGLWLPSASTHEMEALPTGSELR